VGASGGVFAILANCLIFNVRVDRLKSIAVYSLMPLLLISIELSRAFIFEHPMIVSDNRLINLIHISGVLTGYILVVVSLPSDE
jgi:membrane associated rhomboid family serine protease